MITIVPRLQNCFLRFIPFRILPYISVPNNAFILGGAFSFIVSIFTRARRLPVNLLITPYSVPISLAFKSSVFSPGATFLPRLPFLPPFLFLGIYYYYYS